MIFNDPSHYFHYFIDGAMASSLFKKDSLKTKNKPQNKFFEKTEDFPKIEYDTINYVGLSSGGGVGLTACAVYSFDKCTLIAGFLPAYLRIKSANNIGDSEQYSSSINKKFPTEDLIRIASSVTKSIIYIYNSEDPCCFADPYASKFKKDFNKFDIRVTDLNFHGYNN